MTFKILFIVLLLCVFTLGCNKKEIQYQCINKIPIASLLSKKKNLIYFWTDWCGASKKVLKKTYSQLRKDTTDFNVIIICGSHKHEFVNKFFIDNQLTYPKYVLCNYYNITPILDRIAIKKFINNNFKNIDNKILKGNFAIPVSMLVDNNMNELNSDMPQDTANIKNIIHSFH